jgi:hypothetical protein
LNGHIDSDSGWAQAWFRYGRSRGDLDNTTNMVTMFGDSRQSFSWNIVKDRLVAGDTYYFQAMGRNEFGTDQGDILSFTVSDNGGTPATGNSPIVATGSATVLGSNSAILRAQVNPNGYLSSVWFEYGRTTGLGGVTTRDPAGNGGFMTDYSVTLTGLSAGTTYYYRAVAQNPYGTNRGQMLSFTTQGIPATGGPGAVASPAPAPTPSDTPGCFTVSPALNAPQFNANDDFVYSVTYNNSCGSALTNASLQITLPLAVDFAATNFPFLSRDGNTITYNLGSVAPNLQATVTVNGKVKSQVNSGDMLVFQANLSFTDSRGNVQNASAYLTAAIAAGAEPEGASTSTLGASVADTLSGLFHSGWFWLVLFLILIALFVFWLATRRRVDEEEDDEAIEVAH